MAPAPAPPVNLARPTEIEDFLTWKDAAVSAIAQRPQDASPEKPHPILGSITCYKDPKDSDYGYCDSSKVADDGEQMYFGNWKRNQPSAWQLLVSAGLDREFLCESVDAETLRRYRYASATKFHCKVDAKHHLLIEHYPEGSAVTSTKLVWFSPEYAKARPSFAKVLTDGRDMHPAAETAKPLSNTPATRENVAAWAQYEIHKRRITKDPPASLHDLILVLGDPATCVPAEARNLSTCYWTYTEDQATKIFSYVNKQSSPQASVVHSVFFVRDGEIQGEVKGLSVQLFR